MNPLIKALTESPDDDLDVNGCVAKVDPVKMARARLERAGIRPDFFQDIESTTDSYITDIYRAIVLENAPIGRTCPELKAAAEKLSEDWGTFQEALTASGFTGYWNDQH